MNITSSIFYILPELTVLGFALGVLALGAFAKRRRSISLISLLGVTIALFLTFRNFFIGQSGSLFLDMLAADGTASFFKIIALSATWFAVLLSMSYQSFKDDFAEYHALLLFAAAMMMLLVASKNLLMIYLSLEGLSLVSYMLVAFNKHDPKSSEAGLKYFLFGAVASAIMLYGFSLLYGATGTLDIGAVSEKIASKTLAEENFYLILIFILAGFGFKIAMVPFQMWVPDAYEGAPTPITAFLSVGPKAAGFALILRAFLGAFSPAKPEWALLLGVLAILTMSMGNIIAISQTNIKRMLAYSSIAHAGYILIGVVVGGVSGVGALLIYVLVYLLMNLGAFALAQSISERSGSYDIESYKGLSQRDPASAMILTIFLLSLTGLPPLAGFIGKLYIFLSAIEGGYIYLAIAAVINSVIAAFYYFNVVRVMYLAEAVVPVEAQRCPASLTAAYLILLVATFVVGIFPAPFVNFVSEAIRFIR